MDVTKNLREVPAYLMSQQWYVLWAPMGFGGTTERISDIGAMVKKIDPKGFVWYPIYPEMVDGKPVMRAVYPGYMFVYCLWSDLIEAMVQERLPVFSTFLKNEYQMPLCVAGDVMEEVKTIVNEFLNEPEKPTEMHGLKVGDNVKIVRRVFAGQVGKVIQFDPKGKVIVGLSMFAGREVKIPYEAKDLQRI